jgi:hypothetical protein
VTKNGTWRAGSGVAKGQNVAKDKKKKKKARKSAKSSVGAAPTKGKVAKRLKSLTKNPLVADVVAAALVATAAALKDSRKARQLAASAGDELEALAKEGAERGNAMWKLAIEVGKRAVDTLMGEEPSKTPRAPKAAKPRKAPRAPARRSKSGRKPK